jgi:hypothetical protein
MVKEIGNFFHRIYLAQVKQQKRLQIKENTLMKRKKVLKKLPKKLIAIRLFYKTATNVALSTQQRKKADQLQELYPSYFKILVMKK